MAKKILLLILLIIPAFALMLRPGIYTMHDFHVFRQFEFDKCVAAKVLPCRWAPDAGIGYGEPLFNFYGQFPYWLGTIFRLSGFSVLTSVKSVFILSLVLSGISMYFLSKQFWGEKGAFVSALFYVYAPYRAVDVWVRGALPEALAFIFFPLILLSIEKKKYIIFSLLLAALLITHNLSLFMFMPFLGFWWFVRSRDWKFIPAGLLSLILGSFYLLPVIFESKLVSLNQITADYYNYSLHWTTLRQLFISNFWGYGGSTWGPNDTMSFSAGHLHWIVAIILAVVVILRRSRRTPLLFFIALGFIALFLTHGKSEIFWKTILGLPFVQFPWRFLSMSTLFLSLSAGAITVFTKNIQIPVVLLLIIINIGFFKPDIWLNLNDNQYFSGKLWDEQRSSALSDYWPKTAPQLPADFAPNQPVRNEDGSTTYPIVYFPGWTSLVDGIETAVFPSGPLGLITLNTTPGEHTIELIFKDTFVRTLGNITSGITLLGVISWILFRLRYES
ncbi:MAG: hypothetical protein G01um101416_108 [Microgenomates group bacterium Gr01-1014_16]|nr:MAG: hypothetical protein G01um101416_108 [Microgenomates group bacterium Gr01-1014_16]